MAGDVALSCREFGQALFFDTSLSLTRRQSCSACHDPGWAFSDSRDSGVAGAASLGDDGHSLGDRNTPSIAYASEIPEFHQTPEGEYLGGFFLDGRSATLAAQAGEPFLNPVEMSMPDSSSVVGRIRENASYVTALASMLNESELADDERVFSTATNCIAAFERGDSFSTFDSKYDRYVRGEYQLTREEEIGRLLFFSQLVSCHACHLLDTRERSPQEIFTNHQYFNIGVPQNDALRKKNGVTAVDNGLLANPNVADPAQAGKFRVPSLRNVAVTAPYMHNGVFQDLETAILFYDKYLMSSAESNTNPETGDPWGPPEIAANIDLGLLRQGQPIAAEHAAALTAFLRTLTDKRYEALLEVGSQ